MMLPLLGSTLRAEQAAASASGELTVARAKDEFLAMLGHELRNPLAPMMTALQLLRMQGSTSREHKILERQVTQVMRLVDDLLDVSRIARGKVELRKERFELATVTARAVEMASPLLERKQQELTIKVPSEAIPMEGDSDRLAQVFSNLLTNAAKTAPQARGSRSPPNARAT